MMMMMIIIIIIIIIIIDLLKSVVGIATGYGLDGPGIESRWKRDFPHPSRPVVGPTQPPVQGLPRLYRSESGPAVALTTHTI